MTPETTIETETLKDMKFNTTGINNSETETSSWNDDNPQIYLYATDRSTCDIGTVAPVK